MPTLTITATAGSASANSYVTLIEADAYLFAHPDWIRWDALATDEKHRLMVMATRNIDQLTLRGAKYNTTETTTPAQALHFPTSMDIYSGTLYIPKPVKDACCEQALYIEQTDKGEMSNRRKMQLEGVVRVMIANDVDESYDLKHAKEFSPEGMRILLAAGLIELSAGWA